MSMCRNRDDTIKKNRLLSIFSAEGNCKISRQYYKCHVTIQPPHVHLSAAAFV
ncbi:hypothetical protein DAPPUDRAFT_238148 [Daphnia pulex]|uniref:Uncharacterized protein n=1 Tax=Daphnia pulex TaxID=6669 RepID=E9G6S2_DAPPU|nr:hypothetical protein DAPPUDRAFT_238148 [Daphnia pulex]|eukprot:EFX84791.1 hypothetical protein DAPPUDRAFT_238148 [Daphnia pulex]